jgi:hypothetical protein
MPYNPCKSLIIPELSHRAINKEIQSYIIIFAEIIENIHAASDDLKLINSKE